MDRRVINNPLSLATIDRVVDLLELDESATVLDVGCGRGEVLARVVERYPCRGIGVDPKAEEIERARLWLADAGDRVRLFACPIQQVDLSNERIEAALCIGACHAYGRGRDGLFNTIVALKETVQPGGTIVVTEGFWKQVPNDEYLAATGFQRNDLRSHEENAALADSMGLIVLYAVASSLQEWDHFESLTWMASEDRFRQDPANEEARERVEHWRNWRRVYLRWGRDTLGFGLYVLRVPAGLD